MLSCGICGTASSAELYQTVWLEIRDGKYNRGEFLAKGAEGTWSDFT